MDNSSAKNTTNNVTSDTIGQDGSYVTFQTGTIVFCFVVSIFILFSNGCSLFFIHKLNKKRFSIFIGLIFSDLILGVGAFSSVPLMLYKHNAKICASMLSFMEIGVTSSLFHTFCICLERLLAVRSKTTVKRQLSVKGRIRLVGISTIVIGFFFGLWKIKIPFHEDLPYCSLPELYGEYFELYLIVSTFAIYLPFMLGTVVIYIKIVWIINSKMKSMKKRMKDINKKLTTPETLKETNGHQNPTCSSDVQINVSKPSTDVRGPIRELGRDFEPDNVVNHDDDDVSNEGIGTAFDTNYDGIHDKRFCTTDNQNPSYLPTKSDVGGSEFSRECESPRNLPNRYWQIKNNAHCSEIGAGTTLSVMETSTGAEASKDSGRAETSLHSAYTITTNVYLSDGNKTAINTNDMDVDRIEYPEKEVTDKDAKAKFRKSLRKYTAAASNANVSIVDLDKKVTTGNGITVNKFSNNTRRKNKMTVMKTIGVVVLLLVLFTGPGVGIFVVDVFCRTCVSVVTRRFFSFMWFLNSALNPCIYYLTIAEFRSAVNKTCTSVRGQG